MGMILTPVVKALDCGAGLRMRVADVGFCVCVSETAEVADERERLKHHPSTKNQDLTSSSYISDFRLTDKPHPRD